MNFMVRINIRKFFTNHGKKLKVRFIRSEIHKKTEIVIIINLDHFVVYVINGTFICWFRAGRYNVKFINSCLLVFNLIKTIFINFITYHHCNFLLLTTTHTKELLDYHLQKQEASTARWFWNCKMKKKNISERHTQR